MAQEKSRFGTHRLQRKPLISPIHLSMKKSPLSPLLLGLTLCLLTGCSRFSIWQKSAMIVTTAGTASTAGTAGTAGTDADTDPPADSTGMEPPVEGPILDRLAVVDVELPGWDDAHAAAITVLFGEALMVNDDLWRHHHDRLGADLVERFTFAQAISPGIFEKLAPGPRHVVIVCYQRRSIGRGCRTRRSPCA